MPATVRTWWKALWQSELADLFHEVDYPALVRLALLSARAVEGKASGVELSELRQLEDRMGLNPTARQRLRLDFEQTAPPPAPEVAGDLPGRVVEMRKRLDD